MAHRPEDRYPTRRALAEDVERWMADEPVSAWREPLVRRARRWAKRNRTAVSGRGGGGAGRRGRPGGGARRADPGQGRHRSALARAGQRDPAPTRELARSRAAVQARYDLAVEAIKTFHTGVSEDFLLKQDQFKELRDRLLKSAADFYGKLGALLGRETDSASRRALAAANFELAELTGKVGRTEDALAAHRAVLAAREALAAEPGAGDAAEADVGRSLTAVAGLLEATGKTDEALAAYREAERRLAGPAARTRRPRGPRRRPAGASSAGCSTDRPRRRGAGGYRLARADQEALAAAAGAPDEAGDDLATTVNRLGVVLAETGKAGGGRGRVPPGAGDPAEAGRRQPRRHRLPPRAWR